MDHIKDKIDFRQYGGFKGNSITHYLIEFINFILSKQDSYDQTAVLACMVDFSKAFNRQNHHILITKLCKLGLPGWLIRIVVAFLTKREMFVRYKGAQSHVKPLPGGGPQGTLLGLLLFIILINDLGFDGQANNAGEIITCRKNLKAVNELHLKYVDDLTYAESINMPEQLQYIPTTQRSLPDSYHARTGHVLPLESSRIYNQLSRTEDYARLNEMKFNYKKSKVMVFNPCHSVDFMPELALHNHQLEVVDELKLLGVVFRSDLKWSSNTEHIVKKANSRLWTLRRLKNLGASEDDLLDIYTKQVRSVLELAVPAWHNRLTQTESQDIERVQKNALHIVLDSDYLSYKNALNTVKLETLEQRRVKLSLKFARKAEKHPKFSKWFNLNEVNVNTRQSKPKYQEVKARLNRFKQSPIAYLTRLLNELK